MQRRISTAEGFTLIELCVVGVAIGVPSALVLPALAAWRERAGDAAVEEAMRHRRRSRRSPPG
jgi:type II secretory pathway pseudopilin PulG